jgi:hypothetical protein
VFFVLDKVGGENWQVVVQKEAKAQWVQAKVVDLMIGTYIDMDMDMDMQVANVTKDNTRDVEEGEEVLASGCHH